MKVIGLFRSIDAPYGAASLMAIIEHLLHYYFPQALVRTLGVRKIFVSLGNRRLRTETAVISALSIINEIVIRNGQSNG